MTVAHWLAYIDQVPTGFGAREVAKMLRLPVGRVRAYARAGFVDPERGPSGEFRFSFRDLLLLRTAHGLVSSEVPARRVRRALAELRRELPEGKPLTGLHISAEGRHVVVRDGARRWHPASGQLLFDFDAGEVVSRVAPLMRDGRGADDWYAWGVELEESSPARAEEAYRKAIAADEGHAEAHLNLGCLLHEAGKAAAAVEEFGRALAADPRNALAAFNLGVALQDLRRPEEAVAAYERALALDPSFADAHYNLGRLHERQGRRAPALRHLAAYRKLRRS